MLFPEPPAARSGRLGRLEPSVHWFTESTRPEAVESRLFVNDWYSELEDTDGAIAARLCSEVDADHYQAVDELYTHHLLRARFTDVRYEEGDVGPDFRVYGQGVCTLAVEVFSLFQQADWTAEELQHARLADELDGRLRPAAGYFVDFTIESALATPAPAHFARFIQKNLARLPPHDSLALPKDARRADLPTAMYEHKGVRVAVTFIPMRRDAPAKSDPDARIVGTGAVVGGLVTTDRRLKDRIQKKAGSRYAISDVPFLIIGFLHDPFRGDMHVLDALYGHQTVDLRSGEQLRRSDGLFGIDASHPHGRHRRISAVAIANGLIPWNPESADILLCDNPFAAFAWPESALPISRRLGPSDLDDD